MRKIIIAFCSGLWVFLSFVIGAQFAMANEFTITSTSTYPNVYFANGRDKMTLQISDPNFFSTYLPVCTKNNIQGIYWSYADFQASGAAAPTREVIDFGCAKVTGIRPGFTTTTYPYYSSTIQAGGTSSNTGINPPAVGNCGDPVQLGYSRTLFGPYSTGTQQIPLLIGCQTATTTYTKTFDSRTETNLAEPREFIAHYSSVLTETNTTNTVTSTQYLDGMSTTTAAFLLQDGQAIVIGLAIMIFGGFAWLAYKLSSKSDNF